MMNTPSKSELRTLMEKHNGSCVSMFLPTQRTGMETQKAQLSLRNHIREAEQRLFLDNLSSRQVEEFLQPIQALLDDEQFWLDQGDGLALFRSPDLFLYYRWPYHLKEQMIVTDHFYLKPLLPALANDERFYILALSQKEVRLLACSRYGVSDVNLPAEVPKNLADALKYKNPENELQLHGSASGIARGKGGRRVAIFHGQGVGTDDAKDNILYYFQQIDHGLHDLLKDEKAPMLLATVEYLFPLYRQANTYPHLLKEEIPGNPDKLCAETLHERAWPIVEKYFLKDRQAAAAYYIENAGTGRASNNIGKVVPAAYYGRVESLFIAIDQELWGIFNPITGALHVHNVARYHDDDLLDLAATQTLLHDGSVYAVESAKVPGGGPIAAVFRY